MSVLSLIKRFDTLDVARFQRKNMGSEIKKLLIVK